MSIYSLHGYAYMRFSELAGRWSLALMSSSLSAQMTQLAVIFALNNFVILYLLLTRR